MTYMLQRLKRMTFATLLLCVAAFVCGCEADSDIEDNESQKETIVSYLEGSHSPTLIAESDVASSLYDDPEFYIRYGNFAFRYIEDYYNVERDTKSEVKAGSTILINFRLYEFTGSSISSDTLPVYTNESIYESMYIDAGLNTEHWTFSPMEIVVGRTTLLTSIQEGLIGCKEGDVVELYMTRNMAYDDDVVGLVDQWASLVFFCTILNVEN